MPSGVGANTRKNFHIVAVDEAHAALSVQLHEFLNVLRIDPTVVSAFLPRRAGVVAVFLFLNPDRRFGKKIDAAEMVPVRVADDDVTDFVWLDAREFHGFVRTNVSR